MIGPSLGMADDDGAGAGIGQHFGGEITGMGARGLGMAILGADRDFRALRPLRKASDQARRRADQEIGLGRHAGCSFAHRIKLGLGGLEAVHFPVACDQRPDGVGHVDFSPLLGAHPLAEARRQFQIPG
jgi:hypothetical protein